MNGNPMQIIQMLMQSNNPKQLMQNMAQSNPQIAGAFNQMNHIFSQAQKKGMNEEQAVRQYAKQNNIDITPMINAMRNRGFRF